MKQTIRALYVGVCASRRWPDTSRRYFLEHFQELCAVAFLNVSNLSASILSLHAWHGIQTWLSSRDAKRYDWPSSSIILTALVTCGSELINHKCLKVNFCHVFNSFLWLTLMMPSIRMCESYESGKTDLTSCHSCGFDDWGKS